MGDDRPESPGRATRSAPWERRFSTSTEPPKPTSGRAADKRAARKLWTPRKRAEELSVAALVEKVGRDDDDNGPTRAVERESPTEEIPAVPVSQAPPPKIERVATPAAPEVVGKPVLTRLAINRRRRQKKLRVVGRTAAALLAVISVLLTGIVWGYLRATDNGFLQVAALDENSTDVVDPIGQTGDETYLIVGTDTRAGANGEVGAGTADQFEGTARSDTVMLVNIPANRQRVVAVSFPRDLDVSRPVCQGWDNNKGTYTDETFEAADGDKLNATYALGGPKCLVKVIQKMSGLKIGHFVGMDFSGFESMVNEVGGVQVCTTTPLVDGELGDVLTQTGTQTIDGKTALNYVRARNIESEGNGDYGRIKRQQRFLSSLLRSALSNKVLLDPGKLNGFINAFTRDTFVEKVSTRDLVTLGRSLQKVDAGAVTFITVPTGGTTEYGNEIPRLDDIKALFSAIINDDPLPGEERKPADSTSSTTPTTSAAPPPTTPAQLAVDPGSITLQVSNASGVSGLAATTANSLGAYGFQIYNVGNYDSTSESTVVRYSSGHENEAATVASAVPGATLEESDGLGSIVEVVLGSDFLGTVRAPTTSGGGLTTSPAVPSAGADTTAVLPPDLDHVNAADDSCA